MMLILLADPKGTFMKQLETPSTSASEMWLTVIGIKTKYTEIIPWVNTNIPLNTGNYYCEKYPTLNT